MFATAMLRLPLEATVLEILREMKTCYSWEGKFNDC